MEQIGLEPISMDLQSTALTIFATVPLGVMRASNAVLLIHNEMFYQLNY